MYAVLVTPLSVQWLRVQLEMPHVNLFVFRRPSGMCLIYLNLGRFVLLDLTWDMPPMPAINSKGGILIAWTNVFSFINTYTHNYSCTVTLSSNSTHQEFMLTNVYGPTDNSSKLAFLQELRDIRNTNELPWLVVGDLNLLRNTRETTSTTYNLGTIMEFNHCSEELSISEVPLRGRMYTYSNKRPTPTLSKLVRVFVSNHWNMQAGSLLTQTLFDLPAFVYDHAPLRLAIKKEVIKRTKHFMFERYWLNYPEIKQIVQVAWDSIKPSSIKAVVFPYRSNAVKKAFKAWAKEKFRSPRLMLANTKLVIKRLDWAEEF